MKAIFLVKNSAPETAFEIREVSIPEPGADEVLIKNQSFGLNFADVMARKGLYREAPPKPCVLGYEVCGEVVKAGNQENQHLEGKRVIAFTRFGGYAEYSITKAAAVTPLDDKTESALATALATQYCTAYYSAYELINLFPDENVVIHAAAGGVGTALIQLCKLKGCNIIALTGSDEKFEYLKNQGAHHIINYKKTDYPEKINSILGRKKVSVVFNSVGGSTFKKDIRLLSAGGKIICYGAAERTSGKMGFFSTLALVWRMGLIIPVKLLMTSTSVCGVNMLRIADERPEVLQRCMQEVVKLHLEGKIHPKLGASFPFNDISKAHALLESGKSTGKIAVKINT